MSHNQLRSERSDSQYRKPARSGSSNQQSHYQGSVPVKGGGGASSATSNSGNRSFKKYAVNAQGGQSRIKNPDIDPVSAAQALHNHGESDVPLASTISRNTVLKDTSLNVSGASDFKLSSSNVPTSVPLSNTASITSDSKVQMASAKEDASRSFPLQFGSFSPGIMSVQIPARTTSAPPNLDEQKKSLACEEASRAAPAIPNPSLSKQHLQKKNEANPGQNIVDETQLPKSKRETQTSVAPIMSQTQKPGGRPVPSMPIQMPFHQPQVPVQFGVPKPQIQSQALPGASSIPLPIPMHIPIGSPPMQPPIFISGLQPHSIQSQGMMHQAQTFNLSAQMAHQIPSQLGNIGINLGHQYPPHQGGKFGSSRKTVKITHPETHEELKLEGSSGSRPHHVAQSQTVPSFPPNHPMNFYPSSFNANSMFFPAVSSVSMSSSTQVPSTSQLPRFYNMVTVKPPLSSKVDKDNLSFTSLASQREDQFFPKEDIDLSSLSSLSQSKPASSSAAEEVTNGAVVADSLIVEESEAGCQNPDQADDHPPMLHNLTKQSPDAEMAKLELTPGSDLKFEKEKVLPTVMPSASVAQNYDQFLENNGGNLENKSASGEELELVKGEAVTYKNMKSDETNLVNSLGFQDARVDEGSEEGPPCVSDTLSGKEEEAEEPIDRSDNSLIIVGTLAESVPLESGVVSETFVTESDFPVLEHQVPYLDTVENIVVSMKSQTEDREISGDLVLSPSSSFKDKVISDTNVAKVAVRSRKKKKDFYRKAEAVGTSSDLYLAYKGPEEKKETVGSSGSSENPSNQASTNVPLDDISIEKPLVGKVEPDDWEDAAEISPQLKSSKSQDSEDGNRDGNILTTKSYSRDFLLKFEEECTDLPEGFEISADIADILVVSSLRNLRDSYPSPGRNIDRPVGSRQGRRPVGLEDEDKWSRFPGPHAAGSGDFREDTLYGTIAGFRPGQGGNFGAMRNQRPQMHLPYAGGILPMQNMTVQGGSQRNYSDADRWQRGSGFQRGLMPSPHTPQPMMHKAERKYEVGKVTDGEEAKQRQLKGILNKLTPQNFEKLFQQVKEVNIDNVVTLSGVISQIFDKALMEPTFCEMYANFCFRLAADLPELVVDDQAITFKRLLLNKCQEEFEKREREEEEANKAEEEGVSKDSPEEREEKRVRIRRRMLGNIRLIGELYKKRMLTERIMHECINKLLGQHQNPDEENIEALCKLMSTIGEIIDHQKAKVHMDAYFQNMGQLSNNTKLSSRVRFMLKDMIDLRKNKWQQRRKVEGPKKIDEVHRDAAQERHTQSSRLARAPSMGSSARRGSHLEFTPRASSMQSSPGSHMSSSHAVHPQRADERHSYENRIVAVPLPQRQIANDSITLGPQGGLVRGMASRVQPLASIPGSTDVSAPGEIRRSGPGVNGFGSVPERASYGRSDDPSPRYLPESFDAASNHNQSHLRGTVSSSGNRDVRNMDRISDRSVSSTGQDGAATAFSNVSSVNELSEEHLRNKSMAAIKEFYSAKDEKEVILCTKELNAPSFYPSMISIWVTDSFEQKDAQRDLLTNLLVSITKPQVGMVNRDQLIKGFGFVLNLLEDAVNDAPRATEFLGRLFARLISEEVLPFSVISRMVYEGGEELGRLVEIGLAAEVIGCILDVVAESGDSALNEVRSSSSIQLENFRPPGSNKQTRLDKFI